MLTARVDITSQKICPRTYIHQDTGTQALFPILTGQLQKWTLLRPPALERKEKEAQRISSERGSQAPRQKLVTRADVVQGYLAGMILSFPPTDLGSGSDDTSSSNPTPLFFPRRHSSYGRLLDDHDYGSWGNYNNPLYDDS